MTSKQLISICIPTYNGGKHLESSLSSIINQTYKYFEIIIVDDNSADNTWDIVKEFSTTDPRIKIYKNDHNLGLVGNWNRCIDLAGGEWIKFVFQDDIIELDCLRQMMLATKDGSQFVACWRYFIFDAGINEQIKKEYINRPNLFDVFGTQSNVTRSALAQASLSDNCNFIGEPTSILFNKSLIRKYGEFNPNFVQLCDLEFWLRVGLNEGLKIVPKPLSAFRVHSGSTSSKNQNLDSFRSEHLESLLLLHEFTYNPLFSILHGTKTKKGEIRNLKLDFARRAYWLKNLAYANERHDEYSNARIFQWGELAKLIPKIENNLYLLPLKIKGWFNRSLLWRLKR